MHAVIALSLFQALVVAAINDSIVAALIAGIFLLINTALTLYLSGRVDDRAQWNRAAKWRARQKSRKGSDKQRPDDPRP